MESSITSKGSRRPFSSCSSTFSACLTPLLTKVVRRSSSGATCPASGSVRRPAMRRSIACLNTDGAITSILFEGLWDVSAMRWLGHSATKTAGHAMSSCCTASSGETNGARCPINEGKRVSIRLTTAGQAGEITGSSEASSAAYWTNALRSACSHEPVTRTLRKPSSRSADITQSCPILQPNWTKKAPGNTSTVFSVGSGTSGADSMPRAPVSHASRHRGQSIHRCSNI